LVVLLVVPYTRQRLLSQWVMRLFSKAIPKISATEREALAAGTITFEGDIFSGKPNYKKLFAAKKAELTAEEQAFLDGPVEELCQLIDDWSIAHTTKGVSVQTLRFLK